MIELTITLCTVAAVAAFVLARGPRFLNALLTSELGALTLAEADKYSTNQVAVGVAELSIDANPLLQFLPWVPVLGNAYQYQRQLTAAPPVFLAPGGTVTEATPTTTLVNTGLKILIGDADVDNFLRITRSKDQDLAAELLALKSKDFADKLGDAFVYGSIDAAADEFDGMHEILADDLIATQTINISADAVADPASFTFLDQLIDLVRAPGFKVILASRRSIRGIRKLARAQGWDLALSQPQGINRPIMMYSDIPLLPCDFLTDTETLTAGGLFSVKTGGTASSIFACSLDPTGLHGISADDPNAEDDLGRIIQVEHVGTLETKDAQRWRVKGYNALVARQTQSLARLTGISSGDWTN